MGLAVTRKSGESVLIGGDVKVTVYATSTPGRFRLVIDAPRSVNILREELITKGRKDGSTHATHGRR